MSELNITRDSKFIKVLAAQVRNERIDSDKVEEAAQICNDLMKDPNPNSIHQIGQTVAFTVDELQKGALDFMDTAADRKSVGYNEKAAFKTRDYSVKAVIQAKGSTTPRSFVADHQILVDTEEISARPAINILDFLKGSVSMSELIRLSNEAMTNIKLKKIETVLHNSIVPFGSPFYAQSTGGVINPTALNTQLEHFFTYGDVNIIGDFSAIGKLAGLTGMQVNATPTMQYSGDIINERNRQGYVGSYIGANVIRMKNAMDDDGKTPILKRNWLYIIPGGQSSDMRNLKIVEEGSINSMSAQDIQDRVYEILLYQFFGVAFVTGKNPSSGCHEIL